jgi:HAMP domain-containing protein
MKISTTITTVFLVIAIVLTSLGAYNFISTSTDVIEKQVQSNLLSTAESRANHIDTYLEQNIERLKLLTSRIGLKSTINEYNENPSIELQDKITERLTSSKDALDEFERVCVISPSGKVIASSNQAFCGKDVHEKNFFVNGKTENKIYFIEEGGETKLFVTGPFNLDGKVVGVGLTVVKLANLEQIIKDRTGLGETGEVLVTIQGENERIYLFERLFEAEALSQDTESIATAEPMKQALLGNEQLFENTLDYRDEEVIAVSQYIEMGNIGLVAKIDRHEAIGVIRDELVKSVLIIGIIILLIAGLIGWFLGKRITKPLKNLTSDVDEITKGKLDIQLEKSTVFEIQSLTDSLNRVLASLKLAILRTGASKSELGIGELQKKVEEVENKWVALNKNTDDYILLIDDKGRITDYNKVPIDTPREKIIGDTIYRYLAPKSKTKLKSSFEKVNKTGKPESIEIQIMLPKGSRWLSTKIIPLQNNTPEEETVETEQKESKKTQLTKLIKKKLTLKNKTKLNKKDEKRKRK